MAKGFTDHGGANPDNLFAGEYPRSSALVNVTGGNYKKGTILGKVTADGKFTISTKAATNGSQIPYAILAEAVDSSSEDKQAVIYLTGEFNSAALIVGTGHTLSDITDELRVKSIFIKTNQANQGA